MYPSHIARGFLFKPYKETVESQNGTIGKIRHSRAFHVHHVLKIMTVAAFSHQFQSRCSKRRNRWRDVPETFRKTINQSLKMAKQRSIIKIDGTVGDLNFYKTKNGYLVREKTSMTPERIATDHAFQRTRENGAEFGRAGKVSKLMRNAFNNVMSKAKDSNVVSRLTTLMLKVVQGDTTHARGLRTVQDGDLTLLQNFDFNIEGRLSTTLQVQTSATIDRVTGEMEITVPPFIPADSLKAPAGSTHFKFISGAAELDFADASFVQSSLSSLSLPWDSAATSAVVLTHPLTPNTTKPVFLTLGVEFYQEVNGEQYALKSGAFNCLAIIKIDA